MTFTLKEIKMFLHSHHHISLTSLEILKKVDLLVFAKRNESQCHKFSTSYFLLHYCCCEEGWKLKYELQLAPDRFLHYGRKLGNSFCEQQQSLIKISAEEQKNCLLWKVICAAFWFLQNYIFDAKKCLKIHPHLR